MAFELPKLPYAEDALEPHISKETIQYHYGKHHQGYVNKVNAAVENTPNADLSIDELVRKVAGDAGSKKLFNSAAQVWNHTFYWNCLSPNGGGEPTGAIAEAINKSFGSFADFKSKFSDAAAGQFGSGWAWLIKGDDGGVSIVTTSDAETPMAEGKTCVLTIDVWEHAYYVDYRNARPKYIEAFWNIVNWDFVNQQLA
ncbi:superoxide dismutase [Haliangium ochraceum]|uniref:Superoxide dismutase n=1 Tax=Haliangium ochraceum (strain DSM 14365 / JCM 11303 / SMP-2) TaxID=502025 RepID=D0LUJ8_HALO1|nr:superoxide dismutase [Haliangium ochraceum]ACY19321.1 Superoxide dismutase [Haliangium ochraceum DSM 14365]